MVLDVRRMSVRQLTIAGLLNWLGCWDVRLKEIPLFASKGVQGSHPSSSCFRRLFHGFPPLKVLEACSSLLAHAVPGMKTLLDHVVGMNLERNERLFGCSVPVHGVSNKAHSSAVAEIAGLVVEYELVWGCGFPML